MTPEEINRFLASEVMGWGNRKKSLWSPGSFHYYDENDLVVASSENWNPYHSIADAMRVVEKIRTQNQRAIHLFEISNNGPMWSVRFDDHHVSHADLPAAISLAAVEWAKAKGGVTR